jgi:hypothetical protein
MGKFWMVWRADGPVPTIQHTTLESARQEAERLASRQSGEFHVLELVGTATRTTVEWKVYGRHSVEDGE